MIAFLYMVHVDQILGVSKTQPGIFTFLKLSKNNDAKCRFLLENLVHEDLNAIVVVRMIGLFQGLPFCSTIFKKGRFESYFVYNIQG